MTENQSQIALRPQLAISAAVERGYPPPRLCAHKADTWAKLELHLKPWAKSCFACCHATARQEGEDIEMIESDLYDHIKLWIEGPEFAPVHDQGFRNQVRLAAITAGLQWLEGVGSWMRPDLALTVIARRKYDATPILTISAFEVKADVQSLTEPFFQALSYSRFADYCYLAAPCEAGWTPEVRQLAERFGVGLVEFDDVTRWHTYRLTFGAPMHPDPKLRETFIDAAFGGAKDQSLIRRNLLGE